MHNLFVLAFLPAVSFVAASPDQIPLGLSTDPAAHANEQLHSDAPKYEEKLRLYGGLKENECTVNIADAPAQVHDGYTRRGIYFWAYGSVIEDYCIFWEDHLRLGENFPFFQPSCYFDEERGAHRIDTSWFHDEDSEAHFERAKARSLEWWMDFAGCRSGANEFCWGVCA